MERGKPPVQHLRALALVRWLAAAASLVVAIRFAANSDGRLGGPDSETYLGIAARVEALASIFSSDLGDNNYWAMGYPLLLRALGVGPDQSLMIVAIVQWLLLAATSFSIYVVLRGLSNGAATAGFVGVILSPTLMLGTLTIGYETLLMFLVTLAAAIAWQSGRSHSRLASRPLASGIAAGLILGLAFIVQTKVIALLPVFILTIAIGCRSGMRSRLVGFGAGFGAVLLVWSARTYVAFATWNPMTENGPINMWLGNNPQSTGSYAWIEPPTGWESQLPRLIADFAYARPEEFLALQVRKVAALFTPLGRIIPVDHVYALQLTSIINLLWVLLLATGLILFLAGLLFRLDSPAMRLWPLVVLALAGLAVNIPFIAEARMRIPVEPLLILCACAVGWTVLRIWRGPAPRYQPRSRRPAPDALVVHPHVTGGTPER